MIRSGGQGPPCFRDRLSCRLRATNNREENAPAAIFRDRYPWRYTVFASMRNLSATMAMNSEFVGLALLMLTV